MVNFKVVGTLRVPLNADGTRSVPATICSTYFLRGRSVWNKITFLESPA